MAQDVDPLNLSSFIFVTLAAVPENPCPTQASISTSRVPNSLHVASISIFIVCMSSNAPLTSLLSSFWGPPSFPYVTAKFLAEALGPLINRYQATFHQFANGFLQISSEQDEWRLLQPPFSWPVLMVALNPSWLAFIWS
jgi:hypothetical protein